MPPLPQAFPSSSHLVNCTHLTMALVMVTGRYNRGHRRFYRWCSPGGLPAVLERFHRSTTGVPVWPVLPVGYGGTTAASWRRKYRPQPLARTRQWYNRFLVWYNRRATLGLYIPVGAGGDFFSSLPQPFPSCALAAGRHCLCPGVLLALRIRGVSVDPLQGGLLLPDLFPWMPVMPHCPSFFVLGFVPYF